jgi:hypothetical protein
MDVRESTRSYESWLARTVPLRRADLDRKHHLMGQDAFSFLRATFYRWSQLWPEECADLAGAPVVLAVGDLHLENFGTWRDAEGRLIWGVNDFDEATTLPYTQDLVRLGTSALIAIEESRLGLTGRRACAAILEGYSESMHAGGDCLVLAERYRWLRDLAVARLKDQRPFWQHLRSLPSSGHAPPRVRSLLRTALPAGSIDVRTVAREAKPLAPSAWLWARKARLRPTRYGEIIRRAVRVPDPCLSLHGEWLIRRLAPDCSRIELASLPRSRDEDRLLWMMGWEAANVHLGSRGQRARVLDDLRQRSGRWLNQAAGCMAQAVERDWRKWRKRP